MRRLEITMVELILMVEHGRSRPTNLSLEQEEALARDPALLSYFYLVLSRWPDPEIQRRYEFEEPQIRAARPADWTRLD